MLTPFGHLLWTWTSIKAGQGSCCCCLEGLSKTESWPNLEGGHRTLSLSDLGKGAALTAGVATSGVGSIPVTLVAELPLLSQEFCFLSLEADIQGSLDIGCTDRTCQSPPANQVEPCRSSWQS